MDLLQVLSNLGTNIPPQRGTDHSRPELIVSRILVLQRYREIFRNVLEQHPQRIHRANLELCLQNPVHKHLAPFSCTCFQAEVLRIPCAQKLQTHLHKLVTRRF
jgi:hypothetical protein